MTNLLIFCVVFGCKLNIMRHFVWVWLFSALLWHVFLNLLLGEKKKQGFFNVNLKAEQNDWGFITQIRCQKLGWFS